MASVDGFTNAYRFNAKLHEQADPELKRVERRQVRVPITIPHWILSGSPVANSSVLLRAFLTSNPLDIKERA